MARSRFRTRAERFLQDRFRPLLRVELRLKPPEKSRQPGLVVLDDMAMEGIQEHGGKANLVVSF